MGQPTYRALRARGCYLNRGIRAGISGPRHPAGNGAGFSLHLSNNNGQPHQGGLCFGDSGGPILKGSTVYAVNSFVVNQQLDPQPITSVGSWIETGGLWAAPFSF